MTRKRELEAPHRRLEDTPPRIVEKAAVVGYRLTAAVIRFVPPPISRAVIAGALQLAYMLWPAKRRSSSANFAHVLGLPPTDPRVHRLTLRAYREYARYVVELMRLPSRTLEQLAAAVEAPDVMWLEAVWRESQKPLILVGGHVANGEAAVAAVAGNGYPISVVVDDSAYPELFELLRRQREAWGVSLIPWRNLRALFGVLRRNEVLGLVVDWGYRSDGIPVRMFGSWTTLPAGPAVLAAKTGAQIAPIAVRRTKDGGFRVESQGVFGVPSADPADIQRATQRIADSLEAAVRAAPQQWYSFKPVWPETMEEARSLEERAAAILAGAPRAQADGPQADGPQADETREPGAAPA